MQRDRWVAAESVAMLGLFAVAIAARLLYWMLFRAHYAPVSDAQHYVELAANIAHGRGLIHVYPSGILHHTAFRLPLWPLLLGGTFVVFGAHVGVAMALNAGLGGLLAVAVFRLTRRLAGSTAGAVAGVAVALYPPLVAVSVVPLSEPLSLLLMVMLATLVVDERYAPAALAAGLLFLTKDGALLSVAVLAPYIAARAGWRVALRFGVLSLLVVTPWLIRNQIRMSQVALTTSNGYNLAAVYSERAQQLHVYFVDPMYDPTFAKWWPQRSDEVRWDDTLFSAGLKGLEHDPFRIARVAGHNTKIVLLNPKVRKTDELLDGESVRFLQDTWWLVWPVYGLGLAGWVMRRRAPGAAVLPMVVAVPIALSVVFITVPRLITPLDVLACIGLGLFAVGTVDRVRFASVRGFGGEEERAAEQAGIEDPIPVPVAYVARTRPLAGGAARLRPTVRAFLTRLAPSASLRSD